MNPVSTLITYLETRFPVNRLVAILTVLLFVPAGGAVTAWAAKHFPGLPLPSAATITTGLAIGAAGAITIGYKWLDGWKAHEGRVSEMAAAALQRAHEYELARVAAETQKAVAAIEADPQNAAEILREFGLGSSQANPADVIAAATPPGPPSVEPLTPTSAPPPVPDPLVTATAAAMSDAQTSVALPPPPGGAS